MIQIFLIITSFTYGSYTKNNQSTESMKIEQNVNQLQSVQRSNSMQEISSNYFIKFNTDLSKIKAGEEVVISFSPKSEGDESRIVNLETFHEKEAHIILVSDDLEYFSHLHPTNEGDGNYSFSINLPFGGKYELFIEYKPEGSDNITEHFNLYAVGKEKSKAIFTSKKHTFEEQNLSVTLRQAENLYSGKEIHIPVVIVKDDKVLNAEDLDNYLGEKAHAVLIGISDLKFIHVHPMVKNNQLQLHLNIPGQGFYRLWLQFKIDDKLYTTDFVLEVKPSDQLIEKSNHNQHKH